MKYMVKVNGKQFEVEIEKIAEQNTVNRMAAPIPQVTQTKQQVQEVVETVASPTAESMVLSPMPGNVFEIKVEVGEQVNEGDVVVVLEAMKMEIEVSATASGVVKQVLTNIGSAVGANDVLVVIS